MKHIDDMQLIEYVAGGLTAASTNAISDHIASCPQCAQRKDEMIETWNIMGQWDIDHDSNVNSSNIALKIVAKAQKQSRIGGTYFIRTKLIPTALRYAASILIAIGVGSMLGKQSADSGANLASSDSHPEYLAALNMQWSSDLTWSIMQDDTDLPTESE